MIESLYKCISVYVQGDVMLLLLRNHHYDNTISQVVMSLVGNSYCSRKRFIFI